MTDDCPPIRLTHEEVAAVRDALAAAVDDRHDVLVWVDHIDLAFKIKVGSRFATWSPPMGTPAP